MSSKPVATARLAARRRFKIMREDSRPVKEIPVDSPAVFAGRIHALLETAAQDAPGEIPEAYADWVLSQFSARCHELQKAGQ